MSKLSKRFLTAMVLIPLAVWWLLYMPSPWFEWVLLAVAIVASVELFRLIGLPAQFAFSVSALAALALLVLGKQPLSALVLLLFVWLLLSGFSITGNGLPERFRQLTHAQWMFIWLFLCVWAISEIHAYSNGHIFIAIACAGIWAADTAAYTIGKNMGKHKLCPQISPGKTVEGLLAAFAFGVPLATVMWTWLLPTSLLKSFVLAILLVTAGVVGDLAESALKRSVGVKDSGSLLPGHGGVLDRIDAMIVALPVTCMVWISI